MGDTCCHNLWFLKRKFVLVNVQGEVRAEAASGAHVLFFSVPDSRGAVSGCAAAGVKLSSSSRMGFQNV